VPALAKLVAKDKDTAQLWRYYWGHHRSLRYSGRSDEDAGKSGL